MDPREIIINYMKSNKGMITTSELNHINIHRQYLKELLKEERIEKTNRGVYILPEFFADEMFGLQQQFKKGVFSHGTALYLHNLTDRVPLRYTMTFPNTYNTTNAKRKNIDVYRRVNKYYHSNIVVKQTSNAKEVKTYGVEKTLCDIVHPSSKLSKEEIVNAFKEYSVRKDKNLNILYNLAKQQKVSEIVSRYMEVLL